MFNTQLRDGLAVALQQQRQIELTTMVDDFLGVVIEVEEDYRVPLRCESCVAVGCIKEPLALLAYDEDCPERVTVELMDAPEYLHFS